MTRPRREGSLDDFLTLWRDECWPDEFVEAMTSPVRDYEPEPNTKSFLAYQVAIRVRRGLPVPPILQEWFNRYVVIERGNVPQRLPSRLVQDRGLVAALQELFGITKAKAINNVARVTKRETKSVETNLYRQDPTKKN